MYSVDLHPLYTVQQNLVSGLSNGLSKDIDRIMDICMGEGRPD